MGQASMVIGIIIFISSYNGCHYELEYEYSLASNKEI